jgi:hypothetical protein
VCLPRGVYTSERQSLNADATVSSPESGRLRGYVVDKRSTIAIRDTLPPSSVVVYVLKDRCRGVSRAFAEVQARLVALRKSRPSLAAKLRPPFSECARHVAAVRNGIPPGGRAEAVEHVHRAILTVAHAEALAANASARGAAVSDLRGALGALGAALGELSACCLSLTPQIVLAPGDNVSSALRAVTVSLRNDGSRRVRAVRLGVTAARGCTVKPAEEAVFATLAPGQSVRATFTVDLAEGVPVTGVQGHFGFLASKSPAHIRLQLY